MLLEHRADVDAKAEYGGTALHRAAEKGHEAAVRVLLEHRVDADAKDNSGETALHRAARGGHNAVVRLLEPRTKSQRYSQQRIMDYSKI